MTAKTEPVAIASQRVFKLVGISKLLIAPGTDLTSMRPRRETLKIWLWTEAKRQPWEQFWKAATNSKETANRRCPKAFELICAGLVRDGVLP